MAVAAYASDLTDVTNYVTIGGSWSAGGGGAGGLNIPETDFFIIESECASKNAWASDDKWMIGPTQSTTLPAGEAYFVWATHLVPGEMEVAAGGVGEAGLYVIVGTSTTVYYRYYIGGSDTLIYDDRWLCTPIDHVEALHNSVAGSPGTGAMSNFGVGANMATGGPTKGAPLALGGVRVGRAFSVTLGDATAYGTFEDAATYNDAGTRRYGQFQVAGGGYKMQGLFEMGVTATAVDFRDSNVAIIIANTEFVEAGFNGFEVNHASSRVDWTSISVTALGTVSPGYFLVNTDCDVNLLNCTFIGMGDFDFLASTTALGCLWQNCGQITPAGADLTGSTVTGYEGATDSSAVVYNETADPDGELDGMSFTKGTAATHAIEFGTSAPTTMTLRGQTYSGYSGTGSSATMNFLRTTGTTTLNIADGGDTPTVRVTGSHTVTVLNTVDVTFANIISGSRLYVEATATVGAVTTGDELINANVTIDPYTYSHNYEGDLTFTWRVRKASGSPYYRTASGSGTITSTGVAISVNQILDE